MSGYYRPRHWVVDVRKNPRGLDWRRTACGLDSAVASFNSTPDPTMVECSRCKAWVERGLPVAEARAIRDMARGFNALIRAEENRATERARAERIEAAFNALKHAGGIQLGYSADPKEADERLKQAARDFVKAEGGWF